MQRQSNMMNHIIHGCDKQKYFCNHDKCVDASGKGGHAIIELQKILKYKIFLKSQRYWMIKNTF